MKHLALAVSLFAARALAQDGGVANNPMPSNAECRGLPAMKLPLTFGPGERLEFDLDALGMNAGSMTATVQKPKAGVLPIQVTTATNTFFAKIRRVAGTGTSEVELKTLHPQRYREDSTENDVHRVADVRFTPARRTAHLVSTVNDKTAESDMPYASEGLDAISLAYLLRQTPFKVGQALCFDAYANRRMWRVWGSVVGTEHASLPVGEFDAWHLKAEAMPLDMRRGRRSIEVWISNDARRLPLAAMGALDFGVMRATLKAYARPDGSKRAENKGNLTW